MTTDTAVLVSQKAVPSPFVCDSRKLVGILHVPRSKLLAKGIHAGSMGAL